MSGAGVYAAYRRFCHDSDGEIIKPNNPPRGKSRGKKYRWISNLVHRHDLCSDPGSSAQRLRDAGTCDERVLDAIRNTPRHPFIEEALAHQAYDDTALPIGHGDYFPAGGGTYDRIVDR